MEASTADWPLGRLLSTAARLVEHEWNARLSEHNLTHAGLLTLQALDRGPRTLRQLAAASRVEEQTTGRVVDRLERTGHVTRRRDEADRRRVLVERTELGQRTWAAVRASDIADRIVEQPLEDPERFRSELTRLVEALRRERPAAEPRAARRD